MNTVLESLRVYLEASALLVPAYLAVVALVKTRVGDPSGRVKLGYFLLVAALLVPLAVQLIPRSTLLRPSAQIFSGSGSMDPALCAFCAGAARECSFRASLGTQGRRPSRRGRGSRRCRDRILARPLDADPHFLSPIVPSHAFP